MTLILEGIFSGLYHMCPSQLNFQFDTTFMFMGGALMFLTLYQKRHPDLLPGAFHTYLFLALIVLFNILPLSGVAKGYEVWFWVMIYCLLFYIMFVGTVHLYYGRINSWTLWWQENIWNRNWCQRPRNMTNMVLLLLLNGVSLGIVLYGQIIQLDFTNLMLALFMLNLIMYFLFYLVNKLKYGEKINIMIWVGILLTNVLLTLALIFYENAVSDKALPMEESNKFNQPCVLFNYWDYHDIWHILSAMGLFTFMNVVFFIDIDLQVDSTSDIHIF